MQAGAAAGSFAMFGISCCGVDAVPSRGDGDSFTIFGAILIAGVLQLIFVVVAFLAGHLWARLPPAMPIRSATTQKLGIGLVLAELSMVVVPTLALCGQPHWGYLLALLLGHGAATVSALHVATKMPRRWCLLAVLLGWAARAAAAPVRPLSTVCSILSGVVRGDLAVLRTASYRGNSNIMLLKTE